MKEDKIEATSEGHAKSLLQGRREYVVHLKEVSDRPAGTPGVKNKKRPPADEVASTIRQISILLRAGVPLVDGLRSLAEQTKTPLLGRTLEAMAVHVSQGANLSEAIGNYPGVFPSLAVDMARIAEAGGSLAESMSRLADHLESGAELTRKVRSALAYPIVILVISVITVALMIFFILPRFIALFDRMGAQLPWTTKMLISISGHWYIFAASIAVIVCGFKKFIQTPYGRTKLDSIALKMPVLGDVVGKIVVSRTIACMATLLSSGVPMVQALETSASAANNNVVKTAMLEASRSVAEGNATSQALKATEVFPPMVLQMVASGEKTGELPSMLDYVCGLYQREADAKVKSLTSIIEPIMIVVLGVIVGFIAISVIVPIYSLVGGVK